MHLSKSRRVMELEHELEEQIGGFESRKHELERISTERDSALRQLEEATRTIADLREQIVELQGEVHSRDEQIGDLRIDQMKLVNKIDSLEQAAGIGADDNGGGGSGHGRSGKHGGKRGAGSPAAAASANANARAGGAWRPPRHPDLPSFGALWEQIDAAAPGAAGSLGSRGQDSVRSDTTLSVGEWPEELRL